ncbi:uncharacterized protein LOC131160825 [Malania oleifera]|uniref:uncharacterized protein LOC131160825 n=1 Tax=Malania oleifera TaxID=397392 RepID=UPI0025AE4A8E|nr:uncharacterized protein LOC131160825 [Malania oleifera]
MEPKDNNSGSEGTVSNETPSVPRALMRQLSRKAGRWWIVVSLLEKQRVGPSGMTWGHFKEVFFERYFSVSTRDTKADDFSGLIQGTLTVQRYASRYIELSRLAPYLVSNEYKKARRFERGLRKDIRRLVEMLQIREFSILVDKATIVETNLQGDERVQDQRKRFVSSSSYSGPQQG